MAQMNPVDLIKSHKASRDFAATVKRKQQEAATANQTEIVGIVIGGNADRGTVLIEPENGGGVLEAESITNGYLAPGQQVIATINGAKAWVSGMPQ
jgi:hypothetical protein